MREFVAKRGKKRAKKYGQKGKVVTVALCFRAKGVDNPRIRNARMFQRSRPQSSTSLVAMTCNDPVSQTLDLFHLFYSLTPFLCIVFTLDPGHATKICPVTIHLASRKFQHGLALTVHAPHSPSPSGMTCSPYCSPYLA